MEMTHKDSAGNRILNKLGALTNKQPKTIEYVESQKLKSFSITYKKEVIHRGDEPLVFSFVLLDRNHNAFNLGDLKKCVSIGLLNC